MILVSYNDESNKVVVNFSGPSFPRHRTYAKDYVPDPVYGSDRNGYIRFESSVPCICNVDYGDGNKEQYSFIQRRDNKRYVLYFRALDIEYQKNPNSHPYWFYKNDGTEYIPVAPHVYTDGLDTHDITFDFTSELHTVEMCLVHINEFPLLDAPGVNTVSIHNIRCINPNIPFDKIGRSVNIQTLSINDLLSTITGGIPEAVFKLKDLRTLNLERLLVLPDIEESNIRRLKELPKLRSIILNSCGVRKYVKEFNDLTHLTSLGIAGCRYDNEGYDVNTMPDFDEVDKINPNIDTLAFVDFDSHTSSNNWHEFIADKGVENLTSFDGWYCRNTPVDALPGYWRLMRSMSTMYFGYAMRTQERVDTFVNSFYDYVLNWDSITMDSNATDGLRNQFYSLKMYLYTASSPTSSVRPSGTYQAPAGFEQGVSNGQPATPMEKIYVLTQNYKQTWSVKPETSTFSIAEIKRMLGAKDYRYTLVMPEDGIPFVAEGDVLTPYKKTGFDTEEEARLICDSLELSDEKVVEYFKNQQDHE